MPVSREEFRAERIDLVKRIRDILESFPDHGLNAEEVRDALAHTGVRYVSGQEVVDTLEDLVSEGSAEASDFAGSRWYAIIEPDPPRRLGFRAGG